MDEPGGQRPEEVTAEVRAAPGEAGEPVAPADVGQGEREESGPREFEKSEPRELEGGGTADLAEIGLVELADIGPVELADVGPLELADMGPGELEGSEPAPEHGVSPERRDTAPADLEPTERVAGGMERGMSPEELQLQLELESGEVEESQYFERLFELRAIEEEKRRVLVKDALGKFNFFLHLTAAISGIAYLLLLGILARSTLPWVMIPIGLWLIGLGYHFYRAFIRKDKPPKKPRKRRRPKKTYKPLGWIDGEDEGPGEGRDPAKAGEASTDVTQEGADSPSADTSL